MLKIIKVTTTDIHSGEPYNVVFAAGAKCLAKLKYNPAASEQVKKKSDSGMVIGVGCSPHFRTVYIC